ncbi:MAG: hypothetical protein ACTS27_08265, partial [Phycisphaerales bacterium]
MLLASAATVAGLVGCASSDSSTRPMVAWTASEIEPLHGRTAPAGRPDVRGGWLASAPAYGHSAGLVARRNARLAGPPPAPLTATSAWPGGPIPVESPRLPIIYSRWG